MTLLTIKNVTLVDERGSFLGDLQIKGDKIHAIGQDLTSDQVIDGTGKHCFPAFIDPHVHFREPGMTQKEDLLTGSKAALAGGFGTVHLMANTDPVVDSPQTYEKIMERAQEVDLVNILQAYAVTKDLAGQEWIQPEDLPEGVTTLSDDGHGLANNLATYQYMERLAETDLLLMIHEEDAELSTIDYRLAEDVHTMRDVYFAGKTGARLHFCHVSTIDSARAIKEGKALGYPVTFEVAPHHIYLTDSDYKVHPPIRAQEDVDYLIQCLIDGSADCIATDHAPHQPEDKAAGSPGLIGLETSFGITYEVLVKQEGQDLSLIAKLMSSNPARILNLTTKGRLLPGYDADLVLIDLESETTFNSFASKSWNTPFLGATLPGVIEQTLVGGQVKYRRKDDH